MKVLIMILNIVLLRDCPWGNTPVCGVDNQTYKDSCALMANYVQLKHNGGC